MSELISEADAHVARTPDSLVDAALEAAEYACRAAVHSLEAIRLMRAAASDEGAPWVAAPGTPIIAAGLEGPGWDGPAADVVAVGRSVDGGIPEAHVRMNGDGSVERVPASVVDADWQAPGTLADDPRTRPVDVVVHATLCGGDCAVMAGPDGPRCGWEPEETREDRWVGTGEPVVEAPAPAVEGAMPPDHCGKHREGRLDCRACIAASEAVTAWRQAFDERAAAARAAVAAEVTSGSKPMPRGRAEFRAAKAQFDAGRAPASQDQKTAITVMLDKRGITDRDAVMAAITDALGRSVESRNDLTRADASRVIDALNAIPLPPDPALGEADQVRPVAPVDVAVAPSVEHPEAAPDPLRSCGMCGHDHDGGCVAPVPTSEDGEVEPCGCPDFTEPDFGDPDVVDPAPAVGDVVDRPVAPDTEARSDVQAEHVDTTTPAVRGDDRATPDAPDDGFTADGWDRTDDRDEFDRARPEWRDYNADHTPVLATGGSDEPIF